MNHELPSVVSLMAEASIDTKYNNYPIAKVNDHVVRISVMTEPYPWHIHPNSDETFLVVEGRLIIEFENGSRELEPGQILTVPCGLRHRTKPVGGRSVNLTFESKHTTSILDG